VFEIGSSLRRARERLGLELSQAEDATRIRAKYLQALEDERFDVLPAPAYAKGFLRTYADFLGLEGERFVDEFNDRFPPTDSAEAAPLERVRPRRRWVSARLVVIPLALSIALFTWRLATGGGGPAHNEAAAPPLSHVRLSKVVTSTPSISTPAPRPARTAHLTIVATRGTCWLSVHLGSENGKVLYERTLQPGDRVRFNAARLWARLGAPWNLDATLNGKRVTLPAAIGNILVTPRTMRAL
jgi:cytoskeleton protein RodZ